MMPAYERFNYAALLAIVQFVGFAIGVVLWLFGESLIPAAAGDFRKFSLGELIVIYAIFISITGALNAGGVFFGAFATAVVPSSKWFWWVAIVLGGLNSGTMIAVTYVTEFGLLSWIGGGAIVVGGLVSGLIVRPVALTFSIARPRYPPGHCQVCGYDLRKTALGGSCPECGAVAEKPFVGGR